MGDGFALTIVSILFAALGIVLGFHAGEEAGARCANNAGYAVANLVAFVLGSLLFAVVWATGYIVVGTLAIGAIAGAIAGLKFGYGESVGPWKFVDRFTTSGARKPRDVGKKGRRRR